MAARGASAALVLKAEASKHKVITLLHCSDAEFEAFEPSTVPPKQRTKVWSVLELDAAEVDTLDIPQGVVLTMLGLRRLTKLHSLRTDLPFIKNLLIGKGCCTLCHLRNAKRAS